MELWLQPPKIQTSVVMDPGSRFACPRRRGACCPNSRFNFQTAATIRCRDRRCEPTGRANARPMTGSVKQSTAETKATTDCFVAYAPRNDRKQKFASRGAMRDV